MNLSLQKTRKSVESYHCPYGCHYIFLYQGAAQISPNSVSVHLNILKKIRGKIERRITQNKRYKNKTQKKKYKKRRKRYKNYKKKSQQKRTYNKSFTPLSKKTNKAVNLNKTLILPTLIHSVDGTLMVLIDPLSNNPQSTLSSDHSKGKKFLHRPY